MLTTDEIRITFDTGHNEIEDVPAVISYDAEFIDGWSDTGPGHWDVRSFEVLSLRIGGLELSRSQWIELAGQPEVDRVEEIERDALAATLDDDLPLIAAE